MSARSPRACVARSSRIRPAPARVRSPARAEATPGDDRAFVAAKYDLVVIGAGPAGEKGAAQAAYHGKSVAIVDPSPRPGGIAMSTAGIPTKALREGAIYLSGLGQSAFAAPAPGGQDAWSLLAARKV